MAALRRKKLSWTIRADELANALDSRPQFPLLRGGGDKASNGQAEAISVFTDVAATQRRPAPRGIPRQRAIADNRKTRVKAALSIA